MENFALTVEHLLGSKDMYHQQKRENMKTLAEFRDDLRKAPRLHQLFFELTDQCNMSCIHCGSSCTSNGSKFLHYEQVKKVLQSVKRRYKPSSVTICLTGGEPLLHPDFERIIRMIHEMGFPWGITTNGVLIDERMADVLKENHVGSISLSIDGTESVHERFRRSPGSYRAVMRAVSMLQERRIFPQITTVVCRETMYDLDELYKELCQTGIRSWRILNIEPIGRALSHPELLLAPDEFAWLLDYIREKRQSPDVSMEVCYGCSHYLGMDYEWEVRDYYFLCVSGLYIASVLCNGDIYGCLDIERRPELIQGNIHTDDFVDVWEHRFYAFRRDRTVDSPVCFNCSDRFICGGDAAHTWDYEKKVPRMCFAIK